MAQSDVEIVRSMYEAFHGGDAEAALAHFDADVVVDATIRVDSATGQGREELATIIGQWVGSFEEWREEIEEIRDLGSQVCVIAIQRGRGRGSGVEIDDRYALLYEVRGDKIASLTMYRSPAEALAAAKRGSNGTGTRP